MVSKKQKIKRYTKLHLIFSAILFGVYFLSCFFYNPYFFAKDIQNKMHAFADTIIVSAVVLAPPITPVIQSQSLCSPQAVINLDWADDNGSTSYDILRNNTLLVSGLTVTEYQDTVLDTGVNYQYKVIAHGPMGTGIATSAALDILSRYDCDGSNFVPAVTITSIGSQSVNGTVVNSSVHDATPKISGTSNIPRATITWTLLGEKVMTGVVTVNTNGYWEFTVPVELKDRNYILSITASNPNNASMQVHQMVTFAVDAQNLPTQSTSNAAVNKASSTVFPSTGLSNDGQQTNTQSGAPSTGFEASNSVTHQGIDVPVDFSLSIQNEDLLYAGGNAQIQILIHTSQAQKVAGDFSLIIRNALGEVVYEDTSVTELFDGQIMSKNIPIPMLLDAGEYTIDIIAEVENALVTRSQKVTIKELPLIHFGRNHIITYPQFLRNLGWVAFTGVTLTGFMSLLWLREYQIFGLSSRHFVARQLNNRGFVKKGKGVKK